MRIHFLAALAFLTLCSCQADHEDDATPAAGESLAAIANPREGGPGYDVLLSWTSHSTPYEWLLLRDEDGSGPKPLATVASNVSIFIDKTVQEGHEYRYELRFVTGSETRLFRDVSLRVPRDLEFKDAQTRDGVIKVSRLFLYPGSILRTFGKDLRIEAGEVLSQGGAIESFPDGTTAPSGSSARTGGNIEIIAERGKGVLTIRGRGENGGAGAPGVTGTPGTKGKNGQYAISTHNAVDVLCDCGKRESELWHAIKHGTPVEMFIALPQFKFEQARHRCITQPTDGYPGTSGGPGAGGGTGYAGGDSSRISIHIKDAAQIRVDAEPIAGRAGQGGPGGRAGPGGEGGDEGDRLLDRFKVCRAVSKGASGSPGSEGPIGPLGEPGKIIPPCLKLGGTTYGQCT